MGNALTQRDVRPEENLISDDSDTSVTAWLDRLLREPRLLESSPVEDLQARLRNTPFGEVLVAFDRVRPHLRRATEIALYQLWIDACQNTSPLLYAAWFNIGVLFGQ